jgi:ATP-dependent Clp protease ATP-binding subunit ClpC
MDERFTDRARKVMQLANEEARRFNHDYVGTEHILLGLVREGSGVAADVLKNLGIDLGRIRLEVEKIVQSGPDTLSTGTGKLPQTPKAKKVIECSIEEARNLNHNYVGTEHVLLGLLREQEGVAGQILLNLGLDLERARHEVMMIAGSGEGGERTPGTGKSKTPALDSFGRDLTEQARQFKLAPVIGRQRELDRLLQVLGRRTRNNPLLVGESGVGRTALVIGLAQRIVEGEVPPWLRDCRVIALESSRIATAARREVPDLLRAVVNELRRARHILLFLEDMEAVVGGQRFEDAGYALKPALVDGEIRCIATATRRAYRELIAPDFVLAGCFRVIPVDAPSKPEAVEILRGLRDLYEAYHRVRIPDEAIVAAVDLADQHLRARRLPGAAVDALDEACARVRVKSQFPAPDVSDLDARMAQLRAEKEAAIGEHDFEKAARSRDQEDRLTKEKETRVRQWREQAREAQGTLDAAVVAEVVADLKRGEEVSGSGDA